MKAHEIAVWAAWHGRLMVLAWLALLPLGVLIARFFKVTPRQDWPRELDNKFWWRSHLGLQCAGIACMTIAAGLALHFGDLRRSGLPLHGLIGWLVVSLGWIQFLSGWIRGSKGGPQPTAQAPIDTAVAGDHYNMTLRRRIFERVHKSLGYLTLPLSLLATALGLRLADAPAWMGWTVTGVWVSGFVLFLCLQQAGRCRDTYEAIWGPDPRHPGNQQVPIGLGIHRRGKQTGENTS